MSLKEIWIADDSPVYRELIAKFLTEKTGLFCRTFAHGNELLKHYKGEDPKAIVLDYHFSFDDYKDNAQKTLISLKGKGCRCPIVLATGASERGKTMMQFNKIFDKFEDHFLNDLLKYLLPIVSK
jgi:DNA-binding NtrC family response regulator